MFSHHAMLQNHWHGTYEAQKHNHDLAVQSKHGTKDVGLHTLH